ncbi:hypothetical protein HQ531_03540 [bacterium]|nr:hypothetical protein [bacterium]
MAKTHADYIARVQALVKDVATKLTDPDDFTAALDAAREDLNQNHPRVMVATENGDGAAYEWVLANWIDDVSVIKAVEYPAGERIPVYLEDDEYAMVTVGSLRLLTLTPGATETIKISYTIAWTLADGDVTVPERNFEAVCNRAAAVCCRQLAAHYGQDTDPNFGQGIIQVGGKLPNYLKLAKEFMSVWTDHFETKGGDESSFSIQTSFENTNSDGRGRMFH